MFIGSLLSPDAGSGFRYAYRKRGTSLPFPPEFPAEAAEADSYSAAGSLVTGEIGYSGSVLLDQAVDIAVDFDRECFIDHLTLRIMEKSALASVTVFVPAGDSLRIVGRHLPETGRLLAPGEITVSVAVSTASLVLRLEGAYKHAIVGGLDIFGAADLADAVYPTPLRYSPLEGAPCRITGITAEGEDAAFVAADFAEKYAERFGVSLPLTGGNLTLRLGEMEKEAYTVSVTEAGGSAVGGSRAALLYAAEKLLQLSTEDGIRQAEIEDKPLFAMRGVHFSLPNRARIPFFKRLVKYLLAPLGYNMMILQISAGMEYKSHPKINEAWREACEKYEAGEWPKPAHYGFVDHEALTQDEVRELCAYIRSYGIEIVPEVQSYGHTQYITMAYPALGERAGDPDTNPDLFIEDARPTSFYFHTMCPRHPDYYRILFDVMDEVIEVIRPERYVHIGHDEIYENGKCPLCRGQGAEVYAEEVTRLHDHLAEMGYGTMMWSDMIEEMRYASAAAIDSIPKDIICLSFTWYFHLGEDIEERLYDHGFRVMTGNLYSSHFTRFDRRRYGRGYIGGQVSMWTQIGLEQLGRKGKLYDIAFTANMLWSAQYTETLRRTWDRMLDPVLLPIRQALGVGVEKPDATPVPFGGTPDAVPYDLPDVPQALRIRPGSARTVPVGESASQLTFLHATDIAASHVMWKLGEEIGAYRIRYADGEETVVSVRYAANILKYRRAYGEPYESDLYRHEGYCTTFLVDPHRAKTADGEDCTLYAYTWLNPRPECVIESVTAERNTAGDCSLLLFALTRA